MPTVTLDSTTTLHYRTRGTGARTIVLVHGFPLDGRIFDGVLDPPPDGTRVIIADLPGFGESHSSRRFSVESLADDLHALLQKLGALPCTLGGLSMGGYVALAFSRKFASELTGLMLLDTRAEADSAEGKEKRNKMIAMVRERGNEAPKSIADQMLPNMLAKKNLEDTALVERARQIMQACPSVTIENALAAMRDRPDQTAFLPSISVPTLIIVGEEDSITPKSAAEAMQRAIPRSNLVVIPQAGHLSTMEKPAEVTHAIISFVQQLPE